MVIKRGYLYFLSFSLLFGSVLTLVAFAADPQFKLIWWRESVILSMSKIQLYVIAVTLMLISVVAQLRLWYGAWALIQDEHAKTTPAQAIGRLLVPIYNIYWSFVVVSHFAEAFNEYVARHGKAAKLLPQKVFFYVLVFTYISAILLGLVLMFPLAMVNVETISDLNPGTGVELTILGKLMLVLFFFFVTAALVMWVYVSELVSNTINFFNSGPSLHFPWSWLSIPSVVVIWIIFGYLLPDFVLPQAWIVLKAAVEEGFTTQPTLLDNLGASLAEEMVGFGAAIIISVICGFFAGFFRGYREYIIPLNGMFMAIPPVAWAPLMMLLFGLPEPGELFPLSIVSVIFIAAVNPMIITIIEGVLQIQGTEVKAARVLGARSWQLFVYIYLPASLPFITAALRIGFSQAWRALVAAEMIGAVAGIGWMVNNSNEVGNQPLMLLGIVLIGGLSWLFERLFFRPIEKHYEVWRLA